MLVRVQKGDSAAESWVTAVVVGRGKGRRAAERHQLFLREKKKVFSRLQKISL